MAHAVGVAADVDDMAVVQESVDQGGSHDLVAEDLSPLLEALVRREHGRSALVAPGDHLEEEHRPGTGDRQVTDLVDDQHGGVGEHLHALGKSAGGLSFLQRCDQVGERPVIDAAPGLSGGNGEADSQVRLADAWRAEKDDVLLALDEAELMKALELLAADTRLEAEVEVGELFDSR